MQRLQIADAPQIVMALQDEIKRNKDARYDHRLHALLLVGKEIPVRRSQTSWVTRSVRSRPGSTVLKRKGYRESMIWNALADRKCWPKKI